MDRLFNKDSKEKKEKKKEKKEKKKAKNSSVEEKSLDDVVRDKAAERKKLEEEEQEFQQKKRERERKIIQIEKEELDRREDEVRRRRSEYDQVKKNNEAIEDKLEGKIKELQMELEDKRLDHRAAEGTIDRDITKRVKVINDLRKSLTRRMEEYGGPETISASPSAPELPGFYLQDSPTDKFSNEAYNPFEASEIGNPQKTSVDLGNPFESRPVENVKKSSSNLCKSLEHLNISGHTEVGSSSRGRSGATARSDRYERTRSLHRAETETPALIYPRVPELDPGAGAVYPSVPEFDPGEEDDIFMTLKRSPTRKRAPKTPIHTVD
eukprot:GFUD01011863.1.p1 GENE.GFUD01011863.1~~GFUD01011863.1.p1  ORF type:complete len:324 (+),score=119.05 GFUD01011863.1:108-1079(+)